MEYGFATLWFHLVFEVTIKLANQDWLYEHISFDFTIYFDSRHAVLLLSGFLI